MKTEFMKILGVLTVLICVASVVGCKKSEKSSNSDVSQKNEVKVVASTSWTAAFADIAGVDSVVAIAPAELRHPPEYEVTVSDIQTITDSNIFVYAGFERMMKTLGESVGEAQMVKITCDNSIETVSASSRKIAEAYGSQQECEKRLADYVKVIEDGRAMMEKKGLKGVKVVCNRNQKYLAKELGMDIVFEFGPGPVTSEQILQASEADFVYIIDNVHNPVGSPLLEVAPEAKYLVWRNFPKAVERNALIKVVKENINTIE